MYKVKLLTDFKKDGMLIASVIFLDDAAFGYFRGQLHKLCPKTAIHSLCSDEQSLHTTARLLPTRREADSVNDRGGPRKASFARPWPGADESRDHRRHLQFLGTADG